MSPFRPEDPSSFNTHIPPDKCNGFFQAHMKNMGEFLMKAFFCFGKDIFIRRTVFPAFLFAQMTMLMDFLYQPDHLHLIPFT